MREEKLISEWSEAAHSITLTSDDLYAIYGRQDGLIGILDMCSYREILIPAHDGPINSICVSKSLKFIVSASQDKTARI